MGLSNIQLRMIHASSRKAGLNDAQYRLLLKNVAGVTTSKDLDQRKFEQVMAAIEAHSGTGQTYWQTKAAHVAGTVPVPSRTTTGGAGRMAWKARQLHAQYLQLLEPDDPVYELEGLVANATWSRTRTLDHCTPSELYRLIEAVKSILARAQAAAEERRVHPPLFNLGAAIQRTAETARSQEPEDAAPAEPPDPMPDARSPIPAISPDDIPF